LKRVPRFDFRALYSAVGIFGGGGVIAVFHIIGSASGTREYWAYPIGLLFGFLIGSLYEYYSPPE
jgi:hypothetical protein